jgi:putative intracellular protease/amidase
MSISPLAGKRVAILITNGFLETQLINLQKKLTALGAVTHLVSKEMGFINGWSGVTWGLSYSVDAIWRETLAVDYDMMIVPHGENHTKVLSTDSHAKRIMSAFIREDAPVLLIGSGITLAASLDLIAMEYDSESDAAVRHDYLVLAGQNAKADEMIDKLAESVSNAAIAATAA